MTISICSVCAREVGFGGDDCPCDGKYENQGFYHRCKYFLFSVTDLNDTLTPYDEPEVNEGGG